MSFIGKGTYICNAIVLWDFDVIIVTNKVFFKIYISYVVITLTMKRKLVENERTIF